MQQGMHNVDMQLVLWLDAPYVLKRATMVSCQLLFALCCLASFVVICVLMLHQVARHTRGGNPMQWSA